MTVESTLSKKIYQGNGVAREFPVPYAYSRAGDIRLLLTDASGAETPITSNFDVQKNAAGNTKVIYPVTGQPLASGTKLTIFRDTPRTQIVDLEYGGAFMPEVLENDGFDRLEMQIQEIQEQVDRAVKVSISDEGPPKTAEEFYADMQGFADSAAGSATSAAGSAASAASSASTASTKAAAASASATSAANSATGAAMSAANAASSAARAAASESKAASSENMARKWAENPVEAAVISGHYSAYHWAMRAAASAAGLISVYGDTLSRVLALEEQSAGLRGLVNNLQLLLVGCCDNAEDYRFVHEAVTEREDDGLITDAITAYADWGALTL